MKTKYLLPYSWKVFGWVLVAVCVPFGILMLIPDSEFPFTLDISVPWPASESSGLLDPEVINGYLVLNIIDELLSVGCIAGLFIVGFSRQLIEDERIAQLRLEALQWGVYANYLVLTIGILMIHGSGFFVVLIYNVFTPLLIFVLRFYWLLFMKPALEARKEGNLSL
jgi:hypothetical protein